MSYTYDYPRPALTVDGVIFGLDVKGRMKVLLIKRLKGPFKDCWALPGGFVDMEDEDTDAAVARELEEETDTKNLYLEQLYTFSKKGRDPRERVVSVAYYGLVRPDALKPKAGDDAKEVKWWPIKRLPKLAFDHRDIVKMGRERIKGKVRYQPIGFELLPELFTLRSLQGLYEAILGRDLDKRNFRKKILATDIITPTEEFEGGVKHRPARLYRFDQKEYDRKVKAGFNFEI